MKIALFHLFMLVVPAILALPNQLRTPATDDQTTTLPTDDQTAGNEDSSLDLEVVSENEIRGVFVSGDQKITFLAVEEDGQISATATAIYLSNSDSSISVDISFPHADGRVVPNMEKLIVEKAEYLVERTNCQIPTNLNTLHDELANTLYQSTTEMGMSQLRFSVMYLETVVASALRICNRAKSICTTSPEYTYGEGLFICSEDLEELDTEYNQVAATRREGEKVSKKTKRWIPCNGISGREHGCCGNYAGRCRYCSSFCLWHDRVCTRCDHWYCGPRCRPDK